MSAVPNDRYALRGQILQVRVRVRVRVNVNVTALSMSRTLVCEFSDEVLTRRKRHSFSDEKEAERAMEAQRSDPTHDLTPHLTPHMT